MIRQVPWRGRHFVVQSPMPRCRIDSATSADGACWTTHIDPEHRRSSRLSGLVIRFTWAIPSRPSSLTTSSATLVRIILVGRYTFELYSEDQAEVTGTSSSIRTLCSRHASHLISQLDMSGAPITYARRLRGGWDIVGITDSLTMWIRSAKR